MVSRDFPSLTQLAVFSVAGLATTVVFTRYVLPELLPAAWRPPEVGRIWQLPVLENPGLAARAAVCLLVLVPSVLVLTLVAPPRWENDVAALSPVPPSILARDAALRADLQAPEPGQMIVIRAVDAEDALRKSERVAGRLRAAVSDGVLAGFDAPSSYLPSRQTQQARQALLPDGDRLEAALAQAQAGLPFRPGLFTPFVDAVERTRSAAPATYDDIMQTPLGLRLGALLFPRGDGWTAIIPLADVRDPAAMETVAASSDDAAIHFVDLRSEANGLIIRFRDAAMLKLAAGAGLLFVVLWAGLGSWRRTLVVLLPVSLALLADLAIISLIGQRISLFHLVSVLLVVGTTSDYALFFNRYNLSEAERGRNLRALLLCWGASLSGFGLLSLSSIPVLQAIGTTLAVGLTMGLLLASVLPQPGLRLPRASLKSLFN